MKFLVDNALSPLVAAGLRKAGHDVNIMQEIKKDGSSPTVIILTNYANDFYRVKCRNAGTTFFLDKSTEFEKIPGILRKMASKLSNNQHREAE